MPIYKKEIKGKIKYFARLNFVDVYGEYKTKQSKYFNTKKEAQEEEIRLKINGEQKQSITFNEAFEEFLVYKSKLIKPQTLIKYRPLYNHVKNQIGNVKISKLTTKQLQNIKDSLSSKISTTYKNRMLILLRMIVEYTNKFYNTNNNVFSKIDKFKNPLEQKKEMDFFTYEEFKKFIKEFDNDLIYKTLFMVLYYQGLRIGEANALTWHDIDFTNKTIKINKTITSKLKDFKYFISSTKTKDSNRILPLSDIVLNSILELKNHYLKFNKFNNEWFVFGGIKPLSETTITNKKNNACDNCGLRRIRIHDFRHSCASFYINLGAQPILISKLLGHSKISITLDTYSHLYPNELSNLIKKVDDLATN